METNNTGAEKTKKGLGIAPKFVIGILVIVLCITLAAVTVGALAYNRSITNHYSSLAYQTADVAAGYFTESELREYVDLVIRYNKGEAEKSEIQAAIQSERYQEILRYVENLRAKMGANDIFISYSDLDILKAYTPEKQAANDWNPVLYIMDSYYKSEKSFVMGETGTISPDYRFDVLNAAETGKHSDNIIITNGNFGHILTATQPIAFNGKTLVFITVEIPMLTLESDLSAYIVKVFMFSGIIMILLLGIGVLLVVKTMIRPIETVAHEAAQFAEDNGKISEELGKIKTGDEIQKLSQSLLHMEIDIHEYIKNITRITAEKERISAELNVATQIQADMLPSIFPPFPDRTEFDIYASMNPAKEVGGDFYDFFLIDDDHIALVMADVSGKGVPAALFMVIAKTVIKNHAQLGEYSPAKVLISANEQLCEGNKADLFVTVWLAILEISTGKGKAANAGHEHPVLRRRDGKYELVKYAHSPAVATMEGMRFREHDFELHPGDSLFVYTDGVPEATNAHDELFGNDRMLDALNQEPGAEPKKILENVRKAVDEFVGGAPQFDDLTMLGFTYFGREGK